MAENSWRKNLKRSFLEDDYDSNKKPPEKRVRFPKGKKSKPKQVLEEDTEAPRQLQARARARNQLTADDDNFDEAEETYENDGNRTEDGIQVEAFSLDREKEEGYFDDNGNFVEYVEKKVKDAWLDSIENNPMYMGRSSANDTEKDEYSHGNEKSADELSQQDIGVIKRRIANVLEQGETVLRALRRLKGNNRKEKMTYETKLIFDQLTDDADKLIQNGDYDVYLQKLEVFEREAEGYEKLAQARVNENADTESCDMFGDDEDGASQHGDTNDGSGYVFDESSGYYYSNSLGYYYDPNTGLYCFATTGKWYKYDEETKEYEEVVSEVASVEEV
ncbi:unnamed protein product [Arabis nemorensis]|uniref:OCRE domain-containing protein n=1 Tax=Arabis nemorensis TaxID=586526 RepID=A0A565C700_9BRAS|nr:unnamed protein product [Arabis nemorensis]